MKYLPELFEKNRRWAAEQLAGDPAFFERLCEIQRPKYLWIGCADSRVPANQIIGMQPGEVFVHRNVANRYSDEDLNARAVLEYAVGALGVEHIIVCGHYGCGGVRAALDKTAKNEEQLKREPHAIGRFAAPAAASATAENGLAGGAEDAVAEWIAPIAKLAEARRAELESCPDPAKRWAKLCELNVADVVSQIAGSRAVRQAWDAGRPLAVHGWIYDLHDGLLRDLNLTVGANLPAP